MKKLSKEIYKGSKTKFTKNNRIQRASKEKKVYKDKNQSGEEQRD